MVSARGKGVPRPTETVPFRGAGCHPARRLPTAARADWQSARSLASCPTKEHNHAAMVLVGSALARLCLTHYNILLAPQFDVIGVGLNATDTLIVVPHFPAFAGKARFEDEVLMPGGQVASALAACARLGLRTKYIGAVGDDQRGRLQMESLAEAGIDATDVKLRKNCATQSAYIIVDASTGERTVLWRRDDGLRIDPEEIAPEQIFCGRLLHIAGPDTPAVARAAGIARGLGIPVTVDVDTIYPGFDRVLPNVDYLVASAEFPAAWTGQHDPRS